MSRRTRFNYKRGPNRANKFIGFGATFMGSHPMAMSIHAPVKPPTIKQKQATSVRMRNKPITLATVSILNNEHEDH